MSQLGKIIRDYLSAKPDFATYFPGGIEPDTNTIFDPTPYAVYQRVSSTKGRSLGGTTHYRSERVQFTVVGSTRAQADQSARWLADQIEASPNRQTVGAATIFYWQVEDETDSAEVYEDGSDDDAPTVDIDITGTFKE
jgi:hypothetical protein